VTGSPPSYVLKVVDLTTDAAIEVAFPAGRPNNIVWSPDGAMIAVETYDPTRDHYEAWIVDPATGGQRYILNGCRLVWSPDSRFLAVRARDRPGIAIIEVATGERMQVTETGEDVHIPFRWVPGD
jgi:dipeptidyl aminopeptidase/acylaminoacyl peptidase